MTEEDLQKNFSPEYFRNVISYAKDTGFSEYYLWGSEWWYWKKVHNDVRYWNITRDLFNAEL